MLLVLGVFALASLLVFPDLRPALQRSRGLASLRKTAAYLDDVRRKAVARRTTMLVTIDEEAALRVRPTGSQAAEAEAFQVPAGARLVSMEPGEGRYFPLGHSNGYALTLMTESGRVYRIEISAFTGLARIGETG